MSEIFEVDVDEAVRTYADMVYRLAVLNMKNVPDAEDVFQEVYIKVYEGAEKYQPSGKPMAWLIVIARNLCYAKFNKTHNDVDIEEVYDLSKFTDVNADVENKMLVNTIMNDLNDEERDIIMMHAVLGLKHREISKILNLPLSTVLSKYNRTIKNIKAKFWEEMK